MTHGPGWPSISVSAPTFGLVLAFGSTALAVGSVLAFGSTALAVDAAAP